MGWACVAHLSFCFEETLYSTFHRYASYQISVHLANQKQELPVTAMFVNGSGWNEQSL